MAPMLCQMVALAKAADGIISASSYTLEGAAYEATQQFKKVYSIGAQIAPRAWSDQKLDLGNPAATKFLDGKKENSVLYICFGSTFFPTTDLEQITTLLSV